MIHLGKHTHPRDPRQKRPSVHLPRPMPHEALPSPSGPPEPGTDASIQDASDMMTQRSPDEESSVEDYYGPDVPQSPMNIQRYITKARARQAGTSAPSGNQGPPYADDYMPPEPGVEPDGGGRARNPVRGAGKKSPRWRQRMKAMAQ